MLIKVKIISVADDTNQKKFTALGRANEEFNDRSYYQHVGFSSIPRVDANGIVIKSGETYTMVATTDKSSNRPVLSNAGDVVVYADADKYIKVAVDGAITIINDNGSIKLKATGQVDINDGNLTIEP